MSKRVDATITCPGCGRQYPVKLYRTIWGEYEENRDLVMNDQANFAVWWEPQHDPSVDTDTQGFARMFGAGSFYATAPRVQDWEEFKRTINRYYSGELVGGPVEKMNFGIGSNKKGGCLGTLLLLLLSSISIYLIS